MPAGVLADRYDRRLLMMVGDGCSALGIVFILICMISGRATLMVNPVYVINFFVSAIPMGFIITWVYLAGDHLGKLLETRYGEEVK